MGINNEYQGDAIFYKNEDEDTYEEHDDHEVILSETDWHDWHSTDLLNMWMSLRQYLEDNNANSTLMNKASFHDFAEFVRQFSR